MPASQSRRRDFVLAALEEYERRLTRYAARVMGGDVESARDVVQHSFLKLCEQDPDEIADRLAPWLFSVCRNRAIDELRNQGKRADTDPLELDRMNGHVVPPGSQLEDSEFLKLIVGLIDELPPYQREVADLWSQDFSNQEIAEITGKTEVSVRVGLHRAIKQIRRHPSVRQWLQEPMAEPGTHIRI